ncbi:MAG: hypothetical protein QOE36_76 [Gaiellaceae bacterium]|jgi:lipid-binding SYLF domain-containing protein|nr:hypothetical protein [Gaiellaceae bacterium]MDX6510572.1 hypothetical protein [Gaiellaceae bacterium]
MAAGADKRTPESIRREIETEREELASAVDSLREEVGAAANISGKLQAKLPVVAAGALGAGFVLSGGIGATVRLLFRKGREGSEKARVGRFSFVDRD